MIKLKNKVILSEMAFKRRRDLINRVESFKEPINRNIIKLVVYKDLPQYHNHWKERLATWLYSVSKPVYDSNKKLKSEDYETYVFGIFGNDLDDAEVNLESFKANNKKYPEFEVTKDLIEELFNKYNKIRNLSYVFSDKDKKDLKYFTDYLNELFS